MRKQYDRGDAVVTGASSGIGAELAKAFALHGHRVVLVGRHAPRLAEVASGIEDLTGRRPEIVRADLAQGGGVSDVVAGLARHRISPAFVVNAAGFGLFGRAGCVDIAEQLAVIDVNCRALSELTLALLPSVVEHKGGVLNVGSVGGFFPGPGMAVYFASKAYVQSFSQALREEYRDSGIRVCALCPGPVATRFQARAGMLSPRLPRLLRRDAAAVARAGYRGLMGDQAVVVPGLFNLLMVAAGGLIYHRLCVSFVRRFHLKRKDRAPRRAAVPGVASPQGAVAAEGIVNRPNGGGRPTGLPRRSA